MRRRRARAAGAGLGLSIAKGIVAAHGGRIELEQPGSGTCFHIFLPTEAPGGLAEDRCPAVSVALSGSAPAAGPAAVERVSGPVNGGGRR
jgi:hypothetical protein